MNPKINLSAMVKSKNTKKEDVNSIIEDNSEIIVETKIEEKTEINDEKISLIPKISLSSIKTNKSENEKIENIKKENEEKHKEKKDELLEVLNKEEKNENNLKISNQEENNSNILNQKKINEKLKKKVNIETINNNIIKEKINEHKDIDENIEKDVLEIEKEIDKKVEEEVNKKIKLKIKKDAETENKWELFWNYRSEFIEKESNIIENIETKHKKLRDKLKEPKTRIFLILSLIITTATIIFILFILYPENHSYEKYKKAINMNINNFKNKYVDKPWILEVKNIKNYNFNIYSKEESKWKIIYKYNDIIFNSKEELDTIINRELILLEQKAEIERIEREKIQNEIKNNENELEEIINDTENNTENENNNTELEEIKNDTELENETIKIEEEKRNDIKKKNEKIKTVLEEKYREIFLENSNN